MDLSTVTHEDFEARVGECFEADDGRQTLSLSLISVILGSKPIPGVRERQAFSAIFTTEEPARHPGHVTIDLKNPDFGTLEGVALIPNAGAAGLDAGGGQLWSVTIA